MSVYKFVSSISNNNLSSFLSLPLAIGVDIYGKNDGGTVKKAVKKRVKNAVSVYGYTCDVTGRIAVLKLAARIKDKIVLISALVNNVGIKPTHSLKKQTADNTISECEKVLLEIKNNELFIRNIKEYNNCLYSQGNLNRSRREAASANNLELKNIANQMDFTLVLLKEQILESLKPELESVTKEVISSLKPGQLPKRPINKINAVPKKIMAKFMDQHKDLAKNVIPNNSKGKQQMN
uniref:Uncharacterized protein n=1 Tax=Glossina pallidipes TaxID=7398 RepID=A0A1B0A315_GLOPL